MADSQKQSKNGAEKKVVFSFVSALTELLQGMPSRSRDILEARFGIVSGEPKTLEEIGRSYDITRERVRQVVGHGLRVIRQKRDHPLFESAKDLVESTLRSNAGILEMETLKRELTSGDAREAGALLAFLECLPSVKKEKENKNRKSVYVLTNFSFENWEAIHENAKSVLGKAGKVLEWEEFLKHLKREHPDISVESLRRFLQVSAEVLENVFGQWGLAHWSDVRPRGTREKARLVLKMTGNPLHFREIARLIDEYRLHRTGKKTHPQTVHNELIKDSGFVLVGRGIYALSEWGYRKGTVKDVVTDILQKAGKPMTKEAILTEVLKVREVKRSTISINLNLFFERAGKNLYTVKS
jgi:Fe2+ or Zn2+ uptake regulation protein